MATLLLPKFTFLCLCWPVGFKRHLVVLFAVLAVCTARDLLLGCGLYTAWAASSSYQPLACMPVYMAGVEGAEPLTSFSAAFLLIVAYGSLDSY
jgi:hypothetical protein